MATLMEKDVLREAAVYTLMITSRTKPLGDKSEDIIFLANLREHITTSNPEDLDFKKLIDSISILKKKYESLPIYENK